MVLANPGDQPVAVMLHLVVARGANPAADISVTVPAASAVGVPAEFLASAPQAAVLVQADGGEIVALGASTSLGVQGRSVYALSTGVVLPQGSVPMSPSPTSPSVATPSG